MNIIKTKERIRKGSEQSKRKEFIMVNIEQNLSKIQSLCKRFNVKQLFVFGSANSGDFTESSDIDFLVEFNRAGIKGSFDQYFGFKEALEHLLGREVDLRSRFNMSEKYKKSNFSARGRIIKKRNLCKVKSGNYF